LLSLVRVRVRRASRWSRRARWSTSGSSAMAARPLIEAAEADLGERDDAAASELRQFAAAFRRRIGVSSSG